jgi:uncharacterized membrane protein
MAEEYWVTATDGKEYGPAGLSTLAQWIRERRVVPTTPVRRGQDPPGAASTYPELGEMLRAQSTASPSAAQLASTGDFRVWGFMGLAWEHVRENWIVLGGMFFLLVAIGCVPFVGRWAFLILSGPILVGIWRAVLGMLDGRRPAIGMMFEGFDRFLDAFLACLVMGALKFLGFLFLIVPGVILAIMWMFTYAVLAETKLSFWEAMQASARLTEGFRWRLFLLILAGIVIVVLGLLAVVVGLFIALPVVLTATAMAYRFLQRRKGSQAAV